MITFLVFTALGNRMDASLIFSSMALLGLGRIFALYNCSSTLYHIH